MKNRIINIAVLAEVAKVLKELKEKIAQIIALKKKGLTNFKAYSI